MKVLKKLFVILFVFVFATGCNTTPNGSNYHETSINENL